MGDRTTLAPRALAVCAAVLFAGSVVGVVAVHPAPAERLIGAPDTTTAPTSTEPATVPSSDPSPTVAPVSAAPVETGAPPAGTYRYTRSTGSSKSAPATTTSSTRTTRPPRTTTTRKPRSVRPTTTVPPTTTTARAQTGARTDDVRTVTVTRGGRQGDTETGQLSVSLLTGAGELGGTASMAWGPAGVVVRDVSYRLFGGTLTCDWQPDWVEFAPNLAPGAAWSSAATCTGTVRGGQLDGRPAQMKRKDTHRAVGSQAEQVGGRSFTSWSVVGTTDLEVQAGDLAFTSRTDGTERFAPALGLALGSTVTATVTSFGSTRTMVITEQLVALP